LRLEGKLLESVKRLYISGKVHASTRIITLIATR